MKTIGERVKYMRTRHRLTQKELAERTGISRANIIKIEQNSLRINSDFITALAVFFQVTTDWLILGDGKSIPDRSHGMDDAEKIEYACNLLEQFAGERLLRVIHFIEFEMRTP